MISSFALLCATGAAHADRWHGGWRGGAGWHGPVVRYHTGGWGGYGYAVRQPIYMPRPVIRARYYNYNVRPGLIVEEYGPRTGYVWVRGGWQWNGVEWIWYPGHYQPVY